MAAPPLSAAPAPVDQEPTDPLEQTGQAEELEEKFRLLQKLYTEGLITNDEYDLKRQELLDLL